MDVVHNPIATSYRLFALSPIQACVHGAGHCLQVQRSPQELSDRLCCNQRIIEYIAVVHFEYVELRLLA